MASISTTKLRRGTCAAVVTTLTAALGLTGAGPASAAGCSHARASAAAVPATTVDSAVRCLLNRQRARHHLAPLHRSARLRRAATAHSLDMVARRFFDHVSPGGATLTDRVRRAGYPGYTLGEDIGWGTQELATPAAMVRAWMHSPPHRAVILNGRYREAGVGVAIGTPAGPAPDGAVYTLDVGRR